MKGIKSTLILIFTIAALGFTTACSGDEEDNMGWTDAQRDEYISGCTADGDTQEACECAYGKLSSEYSYSNFKKITDEIDQETFVELLEIIVECL